MARLVLLRSLRGGTLREVIRGGIGGNYVCLEWGGEFGSFHVPSERMLIEKAEYEYAVMSLIVKPDGPPAPKSLAFTPPYSSHPRSIL